MADILLDALVFLGLLVVSGWILNGAASLGLFLVLGDPFRLASGPVRGLPVAACAVCMQYGLRWWGFGYVISLLAVFAILTFWGKLTYSQNATGVSGAIVKGHVLWIMFNAILLLAYLVRF